MDRLFPRHSCVAARVDNPFRCEQPQGIDDARCAVCREALRDDAWRALVEGDRSFAEFVLADDLLTEHGFTVIANQGDARSGSVLALARTRTELLVDVGDFHLEPIAHGRYQLSMSLDEERDYEVECADLTQAWLTFRRLHERLQC